MPEIRYITRVQFDFGSLSLLPGELVAAGVTKPFVVTDAGLRAAGLLDRLIATLGALPHAVFDQTPGNPTEAAVMAATALYRQQACDGLIAFGGGSSIDCAKGVAIMATHPGRLVDYATIEGGSSKITARAAPLFAIPTTAGTGSEVARGSILIVADGRKLGFHSWHLVPRLAILDPELTLGLPAGLTETYLAPAFNPPAEGIALDGLARGLAHIERAFKDGSDREARRQMMSASMQGAMAFQKGLGCVHSLSQTGLRAFALARAGRPARPPSAPRYAQCPATAHRAALQRAGRGLQDGPAGPRDRCAVGRGGAAGLCRSECGALHARRAGCNRRGAQRLRWRDLQRPA